jgi:hypothetical protein
LTPGEYEVTVYAEGYEPQSKLVEVSRGEHQEAPGIQCSLAPALFSMEQHILDINARKQLS